MRGFTMIELLVVATIIVLLSAIGLVSFSAAGKGARDGKRKADMEQLRSALELYRTAVGTYPVASGANLRAKEINAVTALYPTYISISSLLDPKDDGTITATSYFYGYSTNAGGTTYTVSVNKLEGTGASYSLNNP